MEYCTWSSSVVRVVGIQRDLANLVLGDLIGAKVSILILAWGLKGKRCTCREEAHCLSSTLIRRHASARVGAMALQATLPPQVLRGLD